MQGIIMQDYKLCDGCEFFLKVHVRHHHGWLYAWKYLAFYVCKLIPAKFTFRMLIIFTVFMLVQSEPVKRILFGKVSLEWFKGVGSVEEDHSITTG